MNGFTYLMNQAERGTCAANRLTSLEAVAPAHRFHAGMDGYCPTPLVSLEGQAKRLGLGALLVKDESKRFGLNAFKVLGGSYAIAKYLCGKLDIPVDGNAFARLCAPEAKAVLGEMAAFFGARLFSGGLDLGIMFVCVSLIGLPDGIIKILSNVLVIVLNYLFSKLWIFKKR